MHSRRPSRERVADVPRVAGVAGRGAASLRVAERGGGAELGGGERPLHRRRDFGRRRPELRVHRGGPVCQGHSRARCCPRREDRPRARREPVVVPERGRRPLRRPPPQHAAPPASGRLRPPADGGPRLQMPRQPRRRHRRHHQRSHGDPRRRRPRPRDLRQVRHLRRRQPREPRLRRPRGEGPDLPRLRRVVLGLPVGRRLLRRDDELRTQHLRRLPELLLLRRRRRLPRLHRCRHRPLDARRLAPGAAEPLRRAFAGRERPPLRRHLLRNDHRHSALALLDDYRPVRRRLRLLPGPLPRPLALERLRPRRRRRSLQRMLRHPHHRLRRRAHHLRRHHRLQALHRRARRLKKIY
mmetsp:Transcript_36430/g.116771  ORF Transcript_36430/g.116771 Transcript_36430/m.116771 type:complete len:354 (-) Transcript_36430:128-1189(-)